VKSGDLSTYNRARLPEIAATGARGRRQAKKMAQDVILPFDKKMGLWQRFR
jgi:hypothetical protein